MLRPAPKRRNVESALTKSKCATFSSEPVARSTAAKIEADPFTIPGSVSVTQPYFESRAWRVDWKTNA